ncbi:MAG: transglutaminase domain-containing protein [Dehalococcoidales bacterium]|nr:transglutaminase domain-containing protein [Dehalococcoidales bacterium]
MKKKLALVLTLLLLTGLTTTSDVWATPSDSFNEVDGEVFDDWGIYRTKSFGEDGFYQLSETGFRPVIAFESLGEEAALAYKLGEDFAAEYPDEALRAEAIFKFVRDRVRYTPDVDQFGYEEFALNADELAATLSQDGVGYGDCEDSAVLLAVMFRGAGLRSAIAVGEGHTACLVYLPDYDKASTIFKMDGETGWIWAEATGSSNPLGWVPKEFINAEVAVYEIGEEPVVSQEPPQAPSTAIAPGSGGGAIAQPPPFLIVMGFFLLISLFRRRRRSYSR